MKSDLYNCIISSGLTKPILTLNYIIKCIKKYGYQDIALSFNGGKDCTVLLELIRAALQYLQLDLSKLKIMYFKQDNEFNEIKQFIQDTKEIHLLNFLECEGNYKLALTKLFQGYSLSLAKAKPFKAIFMGQRASDPGAKNLLKCSPSDVGLGWPAFDRLNPLFYWSYRDIWQFLLYFKVPYCELYSQGFTSIGQQHNSSRNILLWDNTKQCYQHAALLQNLNQERIGRIKFESKL